MKKEFLGFYQPTEQEIEKSWKDGIFVFDANALLNLYRYTDSTRKDFLAAITKLEDKLFMPYQVGYEYHSNRQGVIESLNNSYNVLSSAIKNDKTIVNLLNQHLRHPSIQIENLNKIYLDFLKKIDGELEKQKKGHPDFTSKDEILNQLTELYDNKVGVAFTKDALKKIYIEGKERYEQHIPPGYKDQETKRKKGEHHVYGDLIIWKEIIALANKEKKPIVFVTDDRKEDWWTIDNGNTLRPREELIKEFYDLTGIRILIYNADSFLHFAKERKIITKIKDATITEVKEVRKADESFNTLSNILSSDAFKTSSHFYPETSLYKDIIRTTDDFKTASQLYNASIYGDIIRTTDAFKTASQFYSPPFYGDMLRTTDAFKTASQFYKPSLHSDIIRTTDALKTDTQLVSLIEQDRAEESTTEKVLDFSEKEVAESNVTKHEEKVLDPKVEIGTKASESTGSSEEMPK